MLTFLVVGVVGVVLGASALSCGYSLCKLQNGCDGVSFGPNWAGYDTYRCRLGVHLMRHPEIRDRFLVYCLLSSAGAAGLVWWGTRRARGSEVRGSESTHGTRGEEPSL